MSNRICHIFMIHCFERGGENLSPEAGISPATSNSKAICCFVMYRLCREWRIARHMVFVCTDFTVWQEVRGVQNGDCFHAALMNVPTDYDLIIIILRLSVVRLQLPCRPISSLMVSSAVEENQSRWRLVLLKSVCHVLYPEKLTVFEFIHPFRLKRDSSYKSDRIHDRYIIQVYNFIFISHSYQDK